MAARRFAWGALLVLLWSVQSARAQSPASPSDSESTSTAAPLTPSRVARDMNAHYYRRLQRDPWRALGWEALCPGAGSYYNGIHVSAVVTLSISVVGAGLWTLGAVLDRDVLWWAGAGTFAAGRAAGLVAAPVGAVRLNAAFRRQLGLAYRF